VITRLLIEAFHTRASTLKFAISCHQFQVSPERQMLAGLRVSYSKVRNIDGFLTSGLRKQITRLKLV
jgi:hypothetical protein